MLKATVLVLLATVALHVTATSARSSWAKRESNPIPQLTDSNDSETLDAKLNEVKEEDAGVTSEMLVDFIRLIAELLKAVDKDSDEENPELEKAAEDFQRKHPGSDVLWKTFIDTLTTINEAADAEDSESTKEKRSAGFHRAVKTQRYARKAHY